MDANRESAAGPVADTWRWLERAVIGLNLCPFAKAVYVKDQVRIVVSDASTERALLEQVDVFVIPTVNPDGANYSFNDYNFQRKNLVNHCTGVARDPALALGVEHAGAVSMPVVPPSAGLAECTGATEYAPKQKHVGSHEAPRTNWSMPCFRMASAPTLSLRSSPGEVLA